MSGFAPGGANDTLARLIGQWLSERLGQPFVIENRPGAASNIATEAVVRAPADGYTLLLVGAPQVINATLYNKLNYNFLRDIAPVASISREASVMVVNTLVPAKTVPEFIAYAKANPGKINMATAGSGTAARVTPGRDLLNSSSHFAPMPYSKIVNPVALRPGRGQFRRKSANLGGIGRPSGCRCGTFRPDGSSPIARSPWLGMPRGGR